MERRVLLAVTLSFLVLVLYQRWLGPPLPPETAADDPADLAASGPGSAAVPPGPRSPIDATGAFSPAVSGAPAVDVAPDAPEVVPVVADARPRSVVVETDFVLAEFDNRGGELVSWKLKHYADENGDPVELVQPEVASAGARPFTVRVRDDPDLTARLDAALFRPSADRLSLGAEPGVLTFDYEDSAGLRARKTFRFQQSPAHPYVVEFDGSVTTAAGARATTTAWGPGLGGVRAETSRLVFQQLPGAVLYGRPFEGGLAQEPDVYRASPGDVPERPAYEGQFDFAGVDNHYFLAVALPGGQPSRVEYEPFSVPGVEHALVDFQIALESGGALPFFIGPKDFDLLQATSADLVRAIDFGFLSVIVVPLHRTLKWIHGFAGNYGWSIILLTVLINIVIFPLRHKSVVAMRKMQELQPEMKAIQARYANLKATDPAKQKMNQEVMELYRRHGANPASGCLPMLLTMPILIAFYRLLSMAVELRGAPFMGWIDDLSVQDPFYVTPVVMGASMVYQQRLQPAAAASPEQQKMMMFMPVIFTVMFLWAPSGLVIYWLTSNLLGIGQTVVTNRIAGPPRVRQVRPPAERQVKTAADDADGPGPAPESARRRPARDRSGPKAARQGKGSRRPRGKGR